jgi:hypothetical protein
MVVVRGTLNILVERIDYGVRTLLVNIDFANGNEFGPVSFALEQPRACDHSVKDPVTHTAGWRS